MFVPTFVSGKMHRGKYTFEAMPLPPVIDRTADMTVAEKNVHTTVPERMKIRYGIDVRTRTTRVNTTARTAAWTTGAITDQITPSVGRRYRVKKSRREIAYRMYRALHASRRRRRNVVASPRSSKPCSAVIIGR